MDGAEGFIGSLLAFVVVFGVVLVALFRRRRAFSCRGSGLPLSLAIFGVGVIAGLGLRIWVSVLGRSLSRVWLTHLVCTSALVVVALGAAC
jgi:hypothetical protein